MSIGNKKSKKIITIIFGIILVLLIILLVVLTGHKRSLAYQSYHDSVQVPLVSHALF